MDLDLDLTMETSEPSATADGISESTSKNSKSEPLQRIDEEQASNTEDPGPRKSKRPHTYTEKGLQYKLSQREKDYVRAKRELKGKIDSVSMIWTDLSHSETLRKERAVVEEFRKNLDEAQSEFVMLLQNDEARDVSSETEYLCKQAVELRSKISERIFELEREEMRSRRSEKSQSSKGTGHSRISSLSSSAQLSILKMKTVTELARKEVEMKYARIEAEKKLEMEKKRWEMEELQQLRSYESAKAVADAVYKLEEEEKNPDLLDLRQFEIPDDTKEERTRDYVSSLSTASSECSLIPLPYSFQPVVKDEHPSSQQRIQPGDKRLQINSEQGGKNSDSKKIEEKIATPTTSSITPVNSRDSRPTTSDSSRVTDEVHHQGIAEAIAEGMEAARLPTPQLKVFNGDPLDWPTWKAAFETVIEKRTVKSNEKILYLLQFLSGPPKKIVEGYQFVHTREAYTEAKRTLERRFGHPAVVAEAFRKRLENWPRISPRDGIALRDFADFLKTCELAMQSIEDLETLNKQHGNKQLLRVLPSWAHPKWGVRVRDHQLKHGDNKFPPFSEFVRFVTEIAEVQCLPVLSSLATNECVKESKPRIYRGNTRPRRNSEVSTLATRVKEKQAIPRDGKKVHCHWCGSASHGLDLCHEFMKKPRKEITQFIIRKGLCLKCLTHGHMSKENKCESLPSCAKCNLPHLTCLHMDKKNNTDEAKGHNSETAVKSSQAFSAENPHTSEDHVTVKCTGICSVTGQQDGQDQSLIVPVWVSSSAKPEETVLTYALIDSQSNATFITEQLRKSLTVAGVESHLQLSTMHKEDELIQCEKVQGLTVADLKKQVSIPLPKVYTRNTIPYKPSQIPKPEVALQWDHLSCIAQELMPYQGDLEVGLLIGTNCPKAIKPRQVIPGADNDPYGIKTDLGWGIVGRVCKSPDHKEEPSASWANKIITREEATFTVEHRAKEILSPACVKQMFERDFHETTGKRNSPTLSVEDHKFLNVLDTGIHKRRDGHYEMPLPLRHEDVKLPNNRSQALRRLCLLKERFRRVPSYHKDYTEFMEDLIIHCAEKVRLDDDKGTKIGNGRINYVPHHGVYHPAKPTQIRVVFDCSAVYKGTSLNRNLLQGPDMTNSLMGVLCRFRQDYVALTCDVKGMFHQFFVNEEYRDLLRFFWWDGGDVKKDAQEYRMKVHLFGAVSSPGCANYGFKKAADDGQKEFGKNAADFMRRDFYVDDGLKSVKDIDTAIGLIQKTQGMCAMAGLKLHKFSSNKKEVIQAVAPEDRAKGLQNLDLTRDPLPIERTLGIMWCAETDSFQFRIVIQDRPLTRRGILSTVCSVYDPLGFVAPLILVGKRILQDLCQNNADWDDPICDELRPRWERWRSELHTLENLRIPRCFKPERFGHVKTAELHHFSDASLLGYGQCSYLRLISENDQIHCSLVMGKARVTPLKPVTIPRLELTAAVVSVKISQWLGEELDYQGVSEYFWTDSQVVLGYISNTTSRFHVFVANRLQQIHDHTKPQQWQYINSQSNPADAASRGLRAQQLVDDDTRWLRGPDFLWQPFPYQVQIESKPQPLDPGDPEVKKVTSLMTHTSKGYPSHFETSRLDRFSNWFRAKRAIAVCLRFKCCLKKGKKSKGIKPACYQPVNMEEIGRAEKEIIGCLQYEHFKDEIQALSTLQTGGEFRNRKKAKQRNLDLKKCSSLYRLDPYLDTDGLLRVGGRLRNASISEGAKHPVILPRRSHITQLILQYCHEAIKHQGSGMTHNEVRQRGYWIIGGTSAVSYLVSRCVICRRLRSIPLKQKLADLPQDRVEPAAPFTYSAVDYFGPFFVKEGRKEVKRYGVIFTCMASRAIHIETANSLETDAFINALRRFQAERGPVRQLRSDCGTNFIGAHRELKGGLKEMNEDKIRARLLEDNCEWISFKFNPPSASHMGGSWERQIRTVRNILASMLEESGRQLDDESFRTLMKEIQAIVNSRPLALNDMSSTDSPQPLTPNHLLTMKTKVLMPPPGIFLREDLYLRKRWRRVQHLANLFWERWRKEFLQGLQLRKKWTKPQRNLQKGDIVMLKDENVPRNSWRLARVQDVFPSKDCLVRKVKLAIASSSLDKQGRRIGGTHYLERPIHKLVLILEADREFPDEEP